MDVPEESAIATQGETFIFTVNDVGRGPLSTPESLQLAASYDNGLVRGEAVACWLDNLDGSTMFCTAGPGVGTDYRCGIGHDAHNGAPVLTHG